MKRWFNENPDLKKKFGRFPPFWNDLQTWEHWPSVKKLYMTHLEDIAKSKERKEDRKTRWSTMSTAKPKTYWEQDAKTPNQDITTVIANNVTSIEQLQLCVFRLRMEEITDKIDRVEEEAERISKREDRSPSPPATYDVYGHRTNTRAMRMRTKLEGERNKIMVEIAKLNPTLKPLIPKQKFQRKVFIPFKEYPQQNLVSLVIGPRGHTQKELEELYQVKIEARGKGICQNSKKRAEAQIICDEDGHFLITGENEQKVEECERYIKQLMDVNSPISIAHKQKQLAVLARIQGKEEIVYCSICGQEGHAESNCPKKDVKATVSTIVCSYCGDKSHASKDCPYKSNPKALNEKRKNDEAYNNFLREVDSSTATQGQSDSQAMANPYMQPPMTNPYMQQPMSNPYMQPPPMANPYMQQPPMANPYMQQPVANPYMQQPMQNPYMQNPYMQQSMPNPYMQNPYMQNPYKK